MKKTKDTANQLKNIPDFVREAAKQDIEEFRAKSKESLYRQINFMRQLDSAL